MIVMSHRDYDEGLREGYALAYFQLANEELGEATRWQHRNPIRSQVHSELSNRFRERYAALCRPGTTVVRVTGEEYP